jgi:hypothetical protein
MKNLFLSILVLVSVNSFSQSKDTVIIKNDSLHYEVTIVQPGFDTWLLTNARPRGFYSLSYLETQNKFYVSDWNRKYYDFYIQYESNVRYGYEVNYILFNYFQYFKLKTGQKLGVRSR